ncbi:MAG: hypothetical protein WCE46_06335 [Methanoregula sp.]|uniref:hypothetical protein n=1 Tax=Methanoregula sp. TaxID=2052170 RepID=UPI003C771A39
MSHPDAPAGTPAVTAIYDILVPVLSFGGAALAILVWTNGIAIDLRFTAAGCVIASIVLAYLAWVRPKKDIVALTTPIYALIFFAVPLDDAVATIILELLYAVSLSILLVRLKYRFGKPAASITEKGELSGPLKEYVDRTHQACARLPTAAAHRAALAFLRFAAGDYGDVPPEAHEGVRELEGSGCAPAFTTAFEIVAEQAETTEMSRSRPSRYKEFTASDAGLLARPLQPRKKSDDGYDPAFDAALDNALLLLFAAGWTSSEADRTHLCRAEAFAAKVLEE